MKGRKRNNKTFTFLKPKRTAHVQIRNSSVVVHFAEDLRIYLEVEWVHKYEKRHYRIVFKGVLFEKNNIERVIVFCNRRHQTRDLAEKT